MTVPHIDKLSHGNASQSDGELIGRCPTLSPLMSSDSRPAARPEPHIMAAAIIVTASGRDRRCLQN